MKRFNISKAVLIVVLSLTVLFVAALGLALSGKIVQDNAYDSLIAKGVTISSPKLAVDASNYLAKAAAAPLEEATPQEAALATPTDKHIDIAEYNAFETWLSGNIFTCLLIAGGFFCLILMLLIKDVQGANKWLTVAFLVLCAACFVLTGFASAVTEHYEKSCAALNQTVLVYQMQNGAFTGATGFLNGKATVFPYAALGFIILALCAAFKLPKKIFK